VTILSKINCATLSPSSTKHPINYQPRREEREERVTLEILIREIEQENMNLSSIIFIYNSRSSIYHILARYPPPQLSLVRNKVVGEGEGTNQDLNEELYGRMYQRGRRLRAQC
jgi:hypothetical protein